MSLIHELIDRSAAWPRTIWHYCTAETARLIITSKQLWLCDCQWMNDASELHWGRRIVTNSMLVPEIKSRHTRQAIEDNLASFRSWEQRWPDISCFSSSPNRLTLWRVYAEQGRGLAIGIDPARLGLTGNFPQRRFIHPELVQGQMRVLADWQAFWFPIVYDVRGQRRQAQQTVANYLKGTGPYKGLTETEREFKLQLDAFAMTMAFKSPHFEDEREYRIAYGHLRQPYFGGLERIGARSTTSMGRHYTPLLLYRTAEGLSPIRSIALGPNCSVRPDDVREWLRHIDLDDVTIRSCRAPLRLQGS